MKHVIEVIIAVENYIERLESNANNANRDLTTIEMTTIERLNETLDALVASFTR